MAVAILRIGGQTRYEPIDYAAREQQFVKHDGVEPAVERRFDRTGISPQLYGIAGLGLDGLIGMRDVRRNEAGDTPSILPRRCRSVVQRVEPEIVANLLRPHTVLPIDEPETGVRTSAYAPDARSNSNRSFCTSRLTHATASSRKQYLASTIAATARRTSDSNAIPVIFRIFFILPSFTFRPHCPCCRPKLRRWRHRPSYWSISHTVPACRSGNLPTAVCCATSCRTYSAG